MVYPYAYADEVLENFDDLNFYFENGEFLFRKMEILCRDRSLFVKLVFHVK